jgi:thioredoxin 1
MANVAEVNDTNFNQEVLQAQIPVLVDFFADWCGPCKMMGPILEKVKDRLENKVKIVKLNTEVSPNTAGEYQISSIPCLILFKNGQEHKRIVGVQAENTLVTQVESAI